MQYLISLTAQGRRDRVSQRYVHRDTLADAVDAARRMLRLHRNTTPPALRMFDRWVIAVKGDNGLMRIVTSSDTE